MRFVIVRHGQSSNNLLYERTGGSVGRHHDAPLTELGHRQAALLAQAVSDGVLGWEITQVHTSLMTRAVQTAAPLADALDLPLRGHVDGHEVGGPFLEDDDGARTAHPGAGAEDLRAISARLVVPGSELPEGWFPGPYEDGHELIAARAQRVLASLRDQHADDDVVAMVTHGAFFQYLFRALLGIGEMTGWVLKRNTAVSLFEDEPLTDGSTVTARRIDWTPHLTEDLTSV